MTLHLVPLPEDAYSLEVVENNVVGGECLMMLIGNPDYDCRYYNLPPGQWRLVGISDEMGEDEWEEVLPSITTSEKTFQDFVQSELRGITAIADSATQSGMSLLRSRGIRGRAAVLAFISNP